jgi:hypothetical protein
MFTEKFLLFQDKSSLVSQEIYPGGISLFHRAFQFTMCFGPTNALVCNKTFIQMSHIKTLKITPTCFDHQLIIIRELLILVKITG